MPITFPNIWAGHVCDSRDMNRNESYTIHGNTHDDIIDLEVPRYIRCQYKKIEEHQYINNQGIPLTQIVLIQPWDSMFRILRRTEIKRNLGTKSVLRCFEIKLFFGNDLQYEN